MRTACQARDHDHEGGPRLDEIGGELVEPLGKPDLGAEADRQHHAGRVLERVAEREEGEEALVAPAEILHQRRTRVVHVRKDGAVVQHNAARGAAGAAGVDDARDVIAGGGGHLLVYRLPLGRGIGAGHKIGPGVEREAAALRRGDGLHCDDVLGLAGAHHGAEQWAGELAVGHDHRPRARIGEDVAVVSFSIGGVGGRGDATCRHDRQVRDAPFGAILGHEHHPVALAQAHCAQRCGQRAHLACRLGPRDGCPARRKLGGEEGPLAPLVRAREEQPDQAVGSTDVAQLHRRHPLIPMELATGRRRGNGQRRWSETDAGLELQAQCRARAGIRRSRKAHVAR
jgi:hypothetical protein